MKIIKQLMSFCLALCFMFSPILCFAANNTTTVTIVCKVEETIPTDQYSVVVVKLLNEDTYDTHEFKLYEYNNFIERFILENGPYSILFARIDNRNDILFDVVSADTFEIGKNKTIYFELKDSHEIRLPTTTKILKTTEESTTQLITTKPQPTLYTLFNPTPSTNLITESETENKTDLTTDNFITEEYTTNYIKETNSHFTSELFKPTKEPTTKDPATEETLHRGRVFIISSALAILLIAAAFIILIILKRRK